MLKFGLATLRPLIIEKPEITRSLIKLDSNKSLEDDAFHS